MGLTGDASRHLLMDPEFWRPRIERLAREPRQLAIFPRPDLARAGIEVVELRLRAHDGARLTALLSRSAFAAKGGDVHLRVCSGLKCAELGYGTVEEGATDLLLEYPPERRLEDRVLDVLRAMDAACSVEGIDCSSFAFVPSGPGVQDEFAIVQFLRREGWLAKPSEG
jgi:hypothetical protein